ncbi:hypothetical protein HUU05_08445 [candidate division KSB1 bacterium]|nr:hypothetical protein [candidate division KSB1 bacterium]
MHASRHWHRPNCQRRGRYFEKQCGRNENDLAAILRLAKPRWY